LTGLSKQNPQDPEQKKTMTCDIDNPGPGSGQAQKCGEVKPVNLIPNKQ
jgi:hypothetical protein